MLKLQNEDKFDVYKMCEHAMSGKIYVREKDESLLLDWRNGMEWNEMKDGTN
jgi:hypothetical protein